MANLASMVTQKNENDQQWREQRQMERENASAMQDALVTEITTLPDLYGLYLQMQGDNPAYSPGNVAMVIGQSSDPGKFATAEKWRSMGRSIAPEEKNKGMNIFARSSFNRGYTLTPVYDIKPYIPYADCHPDAARGFTQEYTDYALKVDFPQELLLRFSQDQRQALIGVLAQDPRPSYQDDPSRVYGVAFAGRNVKFTVDGDTLRVVDVEPYRKNR